MKVPRFPANPNPVPVASTSTVQIPPEVMLLTPLSMFPNPVVIDPAESSPTVVSDEIITVVPRVVEFKTLTLLIL